MCTVYRVIIMELSSFDEEGTTPILLHMASLFLSVVDDVCKTHLHCDELIDKRLNL